MTRLTLLCLMLLGCTPKSRWTWVDECDAERSERIMLGCLQAAQNMSGATSPGNDSDEVVDNCRAAAQDIACKRVQVCYEGCVDGGTP